MRCKQVKLAGPETPLRRAARSTLHLPSAKTISTIPHLGPMQLAKMLPLYQKHFIPLESNPDLFTELAHSLGLSADWAFHDVLSLDDAELLALVPRPALALILVFPTSVEYEAYIAQDDVDRQDYAGVGDDETAMWYRQTINNACGLYAILHALSNGGGRSQIGMLSRYCRDT